MIETIPPPCSQQDTSHANGACVAPGTISLVICAYTLDRWQDLCEAIASVCSMSRPPDQIVLVSDHNDELFKRMSAQFGNICVVANEEARGLSGARNTGVKYAKGRLIAFLDDDAIAEKDWLSSVARHFEIADVYGATSRIDPLWIGARPAWFPSEFLWTVGCSYTGLPTRFSKIRNLTGAAMCIRREAFFAAGGFTHQLGRTTSRLPLSCEETEFSMRTRAAIAGAQIVFDPATAVLHKVPAKRLTLSYFLLRCYAEGVSKQRLVRMFESRGILSTETNYVLSTLPRGILRGFADAVLRGDAWGLGRAGAIALGLFATTSGYVMSKCLVFTQILPLGHRSRPPASFLRTGRRDGLDS